jgi:hypothetical protein
MPLRKREAKESKDGQQQQQQQNNRSSPERAVDEEAEGGLSKDVVPPADENTKRRRGSARDLLQGLLGKNLNLQPFGGRRASHPTDREHSTGLQLNKGKVRSDGLGRFFFNMSEEGKCRRTDCVASLCRYIARLE